MTGFLHTDGGRIGYEVTGKGPLAVLSHGIGDRRQACRFLLAAGAGRYGVARGNVSVRGVGSERYRELAAANQE